VTEQQQLEKYLQSNGLPELKDFSTVDKPGYWKAPALRIAGHFDLDPDWLISDPELGVLAPVRWLDASAPSPMTPLGQQVQEAIDQATYLRHLLESKGMGQPLSIELVLVFPQQEVIRREVGETLQAVARSTDFLHAVGVNLLPYRPGKKPFADADLRRAFCWLLRETRRWYQSPFSQPPQLEKMQRRRLAAVELDNYRMAGKRSLQLEEQNGVRVHLLHGHNGCGKSTLVEALELAWTGQIDRLGRHDPQKYSDVLRHQSEGKQATGSATYALKFANEDFGEPQDVSALAPAPPERTLKANSFRLNQAIMNQLTSLEPRERSRTFLEAFFPEEKKKLADFEQAKAAHETALQALPPDLQDAVKAGSTFSAPLKRDDLLAFLPLPLEALERLARLNGSRLDLATQEFSETEIVPGLEAWDRVLAEIRSREKGLLDQLRAIRTALDDVGSWVAQGRKLQGDFPDRLNRWLELTALADLATRHVELARTLLRAREKGWKLDWKEPVGLFRENLSESELEKLDGQAQAWAKERDRVLGEVMSGAKAPEATPGEPAPRDLNGSEIAALNALGPGLTGDEEVRSLGDTLNQALRSGELTTLGKLTLGTAGWAETLKSAVAASLSAVEQAAQLPGDSGAASRYRQVQDVLGKQAERASQGSIVDQTLLHKIMEPEPGKPAGEPILDRALNEVLWLLTPARWAYDELAISYRPGSQEEEQGIGLQAGQGSEAVLRFNTAELNVFTLALFLLCAVRIENPYRLLILDDPLQNMDELTVTTVARGLARLIRILPEGWEILALFHGEDDLERFRRELPAAVYFLEWHSYGSQKKSDPIKPDPERSWKSAEIQKLDRELIQLRKP
jgi:hypothetical protein